ncbi:hypothetical protein CVT25_012274 [Psilocybe cyanescens]|uniref:Uncharacterized protein n=1 Tax=Psilocybe cyanescens TaxID=93625 RepID=A0A409XH83_PSICY|nr:hypothetical protein CVT25_012274 [Psilocybe cyanescens]
MAKFDVASYNELPMIWDAHRLLSKQLGDDKPGRLDPLIEALSPLFLASDERFKFGICIMHRHFDLKDGERMVTVPEKDEKNPNIVAIVEPSTGTSSNIVAERWMFDGKEFEHAVVDDPASITPPSDKFFEEFRRICKSFGNGVKILGICANNMPVIPQHDIFFLELLHPDPTKDRTQAIEKMGSGFKPTSTMRQSAWVPVAVRPFLENAGSDKFVMMKCVHNCQEHIGPSGVPAVAEISFKEEMAPVPVVGSRNANQL